MTATLSRSEVPIAYSMLTAAARIRARRDGGHLYQRFFLYWMAFDRIYTTIAARAGCVIHLKRDTAGLVITRVNGNVQIPEVDLVHEREKIHLALNDFGEELKHSLIIHEGTEYFVGRTPAYQGILIEYDAFGQRVNGVIQIDRTSDKHYPVWSPIDIDLYEAYHKDPLDEDIRDFLVGQIVEILHTIKGNYLLASKKFDDAQDIRVVEHGLPMLELIVTSFLQ